MTTRIEPVRDQRGSALLMSLVLIFIMTVLGLALFDLGVVESRLVVTSQTDARAFEIAQAGVERALQKLVERMNAGDKWGSGANPYCTGGTASKHGCSETQFYHADPGFIPNLNFDSDPGRNNGAYAIEFRSVPISTYPVPCQDSGNGLCSDLMFVRVTGTLTNTPAGYSRSRTIQLLAQAVPGTCLICGGINASAATGSPINGNINIAGSVKITGIESSDPSFSISGDTKLMNSYAGLRLPGLQRVPQLPLVCPFGRTCSAPSDLVESLGATLKVAQPTNHPAVNRDGNAFLGQNGDQTYVNWTGPARTGKGPLDGIFVANGCTMPCTDPDPATGDRGNFTAGTLTSKTFVDDNNFTKPYLTTGSFPLLTDAWKVFGVQYDHFACVYGSSCYNAPSTSEFFVSRAANVMSIPDIANSLGTGGPLGGLTDDTAPFTVSITFTDQSNASVNAQICWRRLPSPDELTLEFGIPTCATPAPSSHPLLLYFESLTPATSGFNIQRRSGPSEYNFRGSAIVVTNGLVQMEERWQSCWTPGAGSPCENHKFTADSSFTLLTTGDLTLGTITSNVDRMMGLFYAGGTVTAQKQTDIIGSITGFHLNFGGNVPSFFQVIPDANNLVSTITTGGTFSIGWVARFWVECKAGDPGLTTGELCSYRQ